MTLTQGKGRHLLHKEHLPAVAGISPAQMHAQCCRSENHCFIPKLQRGKGWINKHSNEEFSPQSTAKWAFQSVLHTDCLLGSSLWSPVPSPHQRGHLVRETLIKLIKQQPLPSQPHCQHSAADRTLVLPAKTQTCHENTRPCQGLGERLPAHWSV